MNAPEDRPDTVVRVVSMLSRGRGLAARAAVDASAASARKDPRCLGQAFRESGPRGPCEL